MKGIDTANLFIDHVGIINKQEDKAVEFYQNLLGMEKIKESSVPARTLPSVIQPFPGDKNACVHQGQYKNRGVYYSGSVSV